MHWPSMQRGMVGGAHGGCGIGLQLEQYVFAAFERFDSNESETPYQTAAYEQPDSHELTGAISTHSLALEQPYRYLFRIASRCAAYSRCPF
jgi:hypothetical protein